MNKKTFTTLLSFILLAGCRDMQQQPSIVSMQMQGRNGFSETISNKDRLKIYQNADFLKSQPYEKVLRVYGKDSEGKSPSKLTSYHPNGGAWQYLEAVDGRANGTYLEWHENGKIKIRSHVIEGLADLSETAQKSWLFDQECTVWDEQGNLEAEFLYEKGYLIEEAKYYFPSGAIQKIIPYSQGIVHGILRTFDEEGKRLEEIGYKNGKRDGPATTSWTFGQSKSQEQYRDDFLIHGIYFDPEGNVVGEIRDGQGLRATFEGQNLRSLTQYRGGAAEGEVQIFDSTGQVQTTYQIKEGKKTGEEWEYYPGEDKLPKLLIHWFEDQIQGMVKTWYSTGSLESQREMSGNKKHGLSFAYYKSGEIMLMEEYENDKLIKGSYYKLGEPDPISIIEKGDGTATFYNSEGHFIQKVPYERGKPVGN